MAPGNPSSSFSSSASRSTAVVVTDRPIIIAADAGDPDATDAADAVACFFASLSLSRSFS
jgi:hypothetical protein